MKWIHEFQMFLFDLDGLLVDTEYLHFRAYVEMMAHFGFVLDWDFTHYCEIAHVNEMALQKELYARFPGLDPHWKLVYRKKHQIFLDLLGSEKLLLMPGVARLLQALEQARIRRCVVTNSSQELTRRIRARLPALDTIALWVTREEYVQPKPDPECYLKAIASYGCKGDRIVGFEDSVRGILALQQTPALPVLISTSPHPLLNEAVRKNVLYFSSFERIPEDHIGAV